MSDEGITALANAGCKPDEVAMSFGADLRYFGQQNEVGVDFDADPRLARDSRAIRAPVRARLPDPIRLQSLARAGGNRQLAPDGARSELVPFHPAGAPAAQAGAPKGTRPVHLWQNDRQVPVYERSALGIGHALAGPAIIEERETTIVIPPGWSARVDRVACVVATLEQQA